jgi:hypothetical protein
MEAMGPFGIIPYNDRKQGKDAKVKGKRMDTALWTERAMLVRRAQALAIQECDSAAVQLWRRIEEIDKLLGKRT